MFDIYFEYFFYYRRFSQLNKYFWTNLFFCFKLVERSYIKTSKI